jgi:eukaryotic-like serine/threonine-protein kinase
MTDADLRAGVRPGDVLAGKYQVERVLGVGGMGVVVAAHHVQLDETVAIKILLPEAVEKPEARARFEREARAAAKIKSEHVARVFDVGHTETGAPYMIMEYLEGIDLGAWVAQRGGMPVEQAVEFVLQACEAIAEAHALGIVHRDLKPANLFCVRRADGQLSIKVLDFGISKVTSAASPPDVAMTSTNVVVGTPLYMSPEQLQSTKAVDRRTDIWSLGVILFELVAARLPFEAPAVTELAILIATAAPRSLARLRADLPDGFEYVVMRCLEKERERRFENIGELAIALRDYAPRRATASVERILGTMQAVGMSQDVLLQSGEYKSAHAQTVIAPGVGGSAGLDETSCPPLPRPAGSSPFKTSGRMYGGLLLFANRVLPGGLGSLADAVDDASLREFIGRTFDASDRYDVLPMRPLTVLLARLLGRSATGLMRETAAAQAHFDARTTDRHLFDGATLDNLHERVTKSGAGIYDFGIFQARRDGPAGIVTTYAGVPEYLAPWFAPTQAAYAEEVARILGALSVTSELLPWQPFGDVDGLPTLITGTRVRWQPEGGHGPGATETSRVASKGA